MFATHLTDGLSRGFLIGRLATVALITSLFVGIPPALAGGPEVAPTLPTVTSVVSSAGQVMYGDVVTFTATVTVDGNPVSGGTVGFFVPGRALGDGVVPVDVNGRAQVTAPVFVGGVVSVRARYSGTATLGVSIGAVQLLVHDRLTVTTVTSSANPSTPGEAVTFTATVTDAALGNRVPSGTIDFAVNGVSAGAGVPVDADGEATVTLPLGVGVHLVTTRYSSTSGVYASSSGFVNQQVADVVVTTSTSSTTTEPTATTTTTADPTVPPTVTTVLSSASSSEPLGSSGPPSTEPWGDAAPSTTAASAPTTTSPSTTVAAPPTTGATCGSGRPATSAGPVLSMLGEPSTLPADDGPGVFTAEGEPATSAEAAVLTGVIASTVAVTTDETSPPSTEEASANTEVVSSTVELLGWRRPGDSVRSLRALPAAPCTASATAPGPAVGGASGSTSPPPAGGAAPGGVPSGTLPATGTDDAAALGLTAVFLVGTGATLLAIATKRQRHVLKPADDRNGH